MLEQILVNGVLAGLIYVIMALGFTLVFGIMRIVNFAHGDFYMVGAMAVVVLFGWLGWPFFLAVAAAGLIAALIGVVLERALIRPIATSEIHGMIMTLAIGIILQSLALIFFSFVLWRPREPRSSIFAPLGLPWYDWLLSATFFCVVSYFIIN